MTVMQTSFWQSRRFGVLLLTSCIGVIFVAVIGFARQMVLLNSLHVSHSDDRLEFSVEFGDNVAMKISKSTHYELSTKEGEEEWAMLIPHYGHVVFTSESVGDNPKGYTVTLFHQLKCLDIIRQQYTAPLDQPLSKFLHHCMNYLRQTIWCRPNLWLESVKNTGGTASRDYDTVCRDWTKVYDEADRNHEAYQVWKKRAEDMYKHFT